MGVSSDFDKYSQKAVDNLGEPSVALVYALLDLAGAVDDLRFEWESTGLTIHLEKE